jgi:hypothetical protein
MFRTAFSTSISNSFLLESGEAPGCPYRFVDAVKVAGQKTRICPSLSLEGTSLGVVGFCSWVEILLSDSFVPPLRGDSAPKTNSWVLRSIFFSMFWWRPRLLMFKWNPRVPEGVTPFALTCTANRAVLYRLP